MSLNIAALRRECLWIVIALAVGLVVLPPLIWVVGSHVFGPYAAGGTRDLVDHFYRGLGQGQKAFWIIALGPYFAILAVRLTGAAMRGSRSPA